MLYDSSKLSCFIGLTISKAVDLSVLIIQIAAHFNFSPSQTTILYILIGASLFVTFTTTLMTTVLIAYRIHSISRRHVLKGTRPRLNHIFDILVQSAAAYSVATLPFAIVAVIPFTPNNFTIQAAANAYFGAFYSFTAV